MPARKRTPVAYDPQALLLQWREIADRHQGEIKARFERLIETLQQSAWVRDGAPPSGWVTDLHGVPQKPKGK